MVNRMIKSFAFLTILLAWSNTCSAFQSDDSVTVFSVLDTARGFIIVRKNPIIYHIGTKKKNKRQFYLDIPSEGLQNMIYRHRGSKDYCEFSYSDSSKIVVEIPFASMHQKKGARRLRESYAEFIKDYESQTGKQKLTFIKHPPAYADTETLFGIYVSTKYLLYYLNVAPARTSDFDRSIQSIRRKLH